MKKILFVGVILALAYGFSIIHSAPISAQTNSNNNKVVDISIVSGSRSASNLKFYDPTKADITIGTTVTWTNNDDTYHTVTSGNNPNSPSIGNLFDSSYISPGQTFTYNFTKSGTFDYFCFIHPFMKGQVIVK
jgi:plastocyanin